MQDNIKIPISSEPITNFRRESHHEAFVITSDLEMIQQVRVVTLDENGVSIFQRIAADENLTDTQREQGLIRYKDQIVTRQTAGAFVDPQTGQVVEPGTEGAIPQKLFFQNIRLGHLRASGLQIDDDTPVAMIIYALIKQAMRDIDLRAVL